ncbi:hypothetical protein SPSYN_01368 [Sporotomaculum syntrophicum]|uniref:Uncharacterized protein n=1 Tax=Sporotomaculum syntrophicum TaxID=182264 RepID=A0A9D2WPH3_9FIRM|nr:hypothetical protein [Sporotomaculum syntrophicum]KAF1085232.1 hypothetical protein SPSYN_01368 [Sporotomaculum syntrophicum]
MKGLVFLDLLGFSNMVRNDYRRAKDVLDDFFNIAYQLIHKNPEITGTLFSDSLIAYSNDKSLLLDTVCQLYRECLRMNARYTERDRYFLLPRGGISIGLVTIESKTVAPNINNEFIVSPALVHSVKMESGVKGSRLLVAVNLDNGEAIDFTCKKNTRTTLYDDDSIEFWSRYQYKDALWFSDLAKEEDEQKREIEELIDIAIKLVIDNNAIADNMIQHIGTLRIGLLSYSKFFEATRPSELFSDILHIFREDKYWLIWVALIEMAMQSKDSWAVSSIPVLNDFLKKVSLSPGWIEVLKEINKSRNKYIKSLFEQLYN